VTNRPLIYNKLVRDLVPENIAQSGKFSSTGTLDNPAFLDALRLKILEEAHELFHADSRDKIINESADLLELMAAKAYAELPLLERGSSATKPSHAVPNPRISERSNVATGSRL